MAHAALQEMTPQLDSLPIAEVTLRAPRLQLAIGSIGVEGYHQQGEQMQTFGEVIELAGNLTYEEGRQPPYEDKGALLGAMEELASMNELGATVESVYRTRAMYAARAGGRMKGAIWIVGGCETPVSLAKDRTQGIGRVVKEKTATIDVVLAVIGQDGEVADRSCSEKPRTQAKANGLTSYMGGAVNNPDEEAESRRPEPSNLVAATIQDREVQNALRAKYNYRVMSSQEALILPRAVSLVRVAPITGKPVSLQTEMPWAGVRTNSIDGAHLDFLAQIDNTVAVKIGPKTSPQDIKALAEKLNPNNEPGKLVLIFRLGPDNRDKLGPLLDTVKEHAPGAVVMGDLVHGITITLSNGQKTRVVADAIDEGTALIEACQQRDMVCGGFLLETIGSNTRKECIAARGEQPTHLSAVDPGFNLPQTTMIVEALHKRLMASDRVAILP